MAAGGPVLAWLTWGEHGVPPPKSHGRPDSQASVSVVSASDVNHMQTVLVWGNWLASEWSLSVRPSPVKLGELSL